MGREWVSSEDARFMRRALEEAEAAFKRGEVPVGAVLVLDGEVLAAASNSPRASNDPTAHAEVLALREGARRAGNYRLPGSVLYVTLEPCPMCVGAMLHARVARLVYGAKDPKAGAVESLYRLAEDTRLNHRIETQGGLLAEDCGAMLKRFFEKLRSSP